MQQIYQLRIVNFLPWVRRAENVCLLLGCGIKLIDFQDPVCPLTSSWGAVCSNALLSGHQPLRLE